MSVNKTQVLVSIVMLSAILGLLAFEGNVSRSLTISASTDVALLWPFPDGLVCSHAQLGEGPEWYGITIGRSTLADFKKQFGEVEPREDELFYQDDDFFMWLCAKNGVITALKVGSELHYLSDYAAIYGVPDAVTYSDPFSRVVFWFERGIAVNVYINKVNPTYYEVIGFVVYFPYQSVEGYEERWPYSWTRREGTSARDIHVSDARNPFDFEAMIATLTSQPTWTPTPTFTPKAKTTSKPSTAPTLAPNVTRRP